MLDLSVILRNSLQLFDSKLLIYDESISVISGHCLTLPQCGHF